MFRGWLRRRRPWQLVVAACVYWIALFGVTLGHAAFLLWQISRPGVKGNFSVSVQASGAGTIFSANIADAAKHVIWSGSIGLIPLVLLIAAPPLALWFGWLAARRPQVSASPELLASRQPLTHNAAPASDPLEMPGAPADIPPSSKQR